MIPSALSRHLALYLAIGTSAVLAGCEFVFVADDQLVVATTWPSVACARIEAEYAKWSSANPADDRLPPRSFGITWIWLSPGDDLDRFLRKREGVDVILGGTAESYGMLASKRLLKPVEVGKDPAWLAIDSTNLPPEMDHPRANKFGPQLGAAGLKELGQGPWLSGYEKLIRRTERDGQASDAGTGQRSGEGAAISARSRDPERARTFLKFLIDQRGATPGSAQTIVAFDDRGLLADLLHATLVDSREELDAAWRALSHLKDREQSLRWMCEPPPWPPASIEQILSRGGDQPMTMIETLAGQITPDARLRSWLLQSWLTPQRPIDGALLRELAGVQEGRLALEPRFRSWLRAEWTAWARQRYRRVARQARLGLPVPRLEGAGPSRLPPEGAAPR